MKAVGIALSFIGFLSASVYSHEGTTDKEPYFGFGTSTSGRGAIFGGLRRDRHALQLGFFNNIEMLSQGRAVIPPDTVFFGEYRTTMGISFDYLYFASPKRTSLFFGVGISMQPYTDIGRSPSTGMLTAFDCGVRTVTVPSYSLGYRTELRNGKSLGFGYHSQMVGLFLWGPETN